MWNKEGLQDKIRDNASSTKPLIMVGRYLILTSDQSNKARADSMEGRTRIECDIDANDWNNTKSGETDM